MKQNEDAAPSILDDVWRDAMRYRFVRVADGVRISHEAARDPAAYDEAIDRAMRERGCEGLPKPKGVSRDTAQAVLDVLAERRRQIETEGWTPLHDDAHDVGDLSSAAMGYAQSAACQLSHDGLTLEGTPLFWPWEASWFKPSTARRDLIKAGALILAEIERLDRLVAKKQEGK